VAKYSNRFLKSIIFGALIIISFGYGLHAPDIILNKTKTKQYGTPFTGVPKPQDVIMYEVNIRAFSASGNFDGVIDRLGKIKALGINTIWLMPIYPVGKLKSAGGLGSPYSVQNYLEVNPEFGDLKKLRELVDKAHALGMAVILDWVANHTSWDNVWIKNKSWYSTDSLGNIIAPPGTNWTDVAELNYSNPELRAAMLDAMKFWLLQANIDGYRCDAADMVPADFWKQTIDELKNVSGRNLLLLAEGGSADNFKSGFQMNYAWDFYTNLKSVYKDSKSANSIFETHQAEYKLLPPGAKKLRYTTNHDLSAYEGTPVELFNGVEGALSASVITIFTSAVPLLYSSQEVGQRSELQFFTRDPINWSANKAMESQYEKLFSIYRSSPAFIDGSTKYFTSDDLAVFKRTWKSEQYLFIVNVRNSSKSYTPDRELMGSKWSDLINGRSLKISGSSITLNPYGFLILKKD
jgi:glycosidase